jgi:hypothetical protein
VYTELPGSIGAYVGWACAITAAIVGLLNGAVMLISPRSWFRLPRWLRAQGTLSEDRCSTGVGAFQVRLLGAAIIGSLGSIAYEIFTRASTPWSGVSLPWDLLRTVVLAIVAILGFANGVLMLTSPRMWFRLPDLLATRGTMTRDVLPARVRDILVRLGGAAILIVVAYTLVALRAVRR